MVFRPPRSTICSTTCRQAVLRLCPTLCSWSLEGAPAEPTPPSSLHLVLGTCLCYCATFREAFGAGPVSRPTGRRVPHNTHPGRVPESPSRREPVTLRQDDGSRVLAPAALRCVSWYRSGRLTSMRPPNPHWTGLPGTHAELLLTPHPRSVALARRWHQRTLRRRSRARPEGGHGVSRVYGTPTSLLCFSGCSGERSFSVVPMTSLAGHLIKQYGARYASRALSAVFLRSS